MEEEMGVTSGVSVLKAGGMFVCMAVHTCLHMCTWVSFAALRVPLCKDVGVVYFVCACVLLRVVFRYCCITVCVISLESLGKSACV